MTFFENFENYEKIENFKQNVGKRLSHKEKKRILSLDTLHESIDSGSVVRGWLEKKTSLEPQIVGRKKMSKKNSHSLLQRIRKQISTVYAIFL